MEPSGLIIPEQDPKLLSDLVLDHGNNCLKNVRGNPFVQILLLSFNPNSNIAVMAIVG